ncbi:MAG TPA: phosphatidylserine decarboxylase [Candidatus Woesearchaeota archaeon]|jgi:phosphatidylserine decarboxylase|nr:phosphatidylserine decarboxylase [Candidatus Woesearchaeota archaeon]HJN56520.1 phosphatidylserine decarboxylase [Candidatus Woesearchaeota archaeon]|tara:strand:- start:10157 stop:10768 length:612 start_codon:yes stop_codon:yes gene_type:complete
MLWLLILIIVVLLLIIFLLNFYRDPKRKIPKGDNILSPADGKVIGILKFKQDKVRVNKGLFGKIETLAKDIAKECYVISIFMSVFDVHVNRAPIDGKIISVKHEKGKFFAAYDLKKSLQNEKNEVIIKNNKVGKVKVIQIAGFLARRVVCKVNKNEKVIKGRRIGKIVLGSQVTLILPANKVKLKVRVGQKVKAGSTILAELV